MLADSLQFVAWLLIGAGAITFVVDGAIQLARIIDVRRAKQFCLKCGYRRRGWSSTICPECGTDVQEATSRAKRWSLWSAGLLLAAVVAGSVVALAWPPVVSRNTVTDYETSFTCHSKSLQDYYPEIDKIRPVPGYRTVDIAFAGVFEDDATLIDGAGSLTLNGVQGSQTLQFDPRNIPTSSAIVQAIATVAGAKTSDVSPEIATELLGQINWFHTGKMYFFDANGMRWMSRDRGLSTDLYNGWGGGGGTSSWPRTTRRGGAILWAIYVGVFLLVFLPLRGRSIRLPVSRESK